MTAPKLTRWYWRTYPVVEVTSLLWLARMKVTGRTVGGTVKRCDWCQVTLTGARRWLASTCRTCGPHYQVDRRRPSRG
jgi:hypothetical protein